VRYTLRPRKQLSTELILHWTECVVCEAETEAVETAEHRARKWSIANPVLNTIAVRHMTGTWLVRVCYFLKQKCEESCVPAVMSLCIQHERKFWTNQSNGRRYTKIRIMKVFRGATFQGFLEQISVCVVCFTQYFDDCTLISIILYRKSPGRSIQMMKCRVLHLTLYRRSADCFI